jgi:hypothetical protein
MGFFEKYIGRPIYNWINKGGGLIAVIYLAVLGIFCALVGYYGQVGFNWKMFVFAELPLYAFCIWAICGMVKIWNTSKKWRDKE